MFRSPPAATFQPGHGPSVLDKVRRGEQHTPCQSDDETDDPKAEVLVLAATDHLLHCASERLNLLAHTNLEAVDACRQITELTD